MAKIEFSTYLHDSDMSFEPETYLGGRWAKLSEVDEALLVEHWTDLTHHFEQNRDKPFYEVELRCSLDLDTYEIEILRLA